MLQAWTGRVDQRQHAGKGRVRLAAGGEGGGLGQVEDLAACGVDGADRPVAAAAEGGEFHGGYSSMMATARVQPADAALIFTGKQATLNPWAGSSSRLCSFSMWQ